MFEYVLFTFVIVAFPMSITRIRIAFRFWHGLVSLLLGLLLTRCNFNSLVFFVLSFKQSIFHAAQRKCFKFN